jgi:hypothetical protein
MNYELKKTKTITINKKILILVFPPSFYLRSLNARLQSQQQADKNTP